MPSRKNTSAAMRTSSSTCWPAHCWTLRRGTAGTTQLMEQSAITDTVKTGHTAVAQQAHNAWTRQVRISNHPGQSIPHGGEKVASLLRQGRWVCRHSEDRQLPIGFCFSFPCTHTAIGEAIMVKLTKRFENEGLVGEDPAKGLQRALDRQKANVRSHHSLPACAQQGLCMLTDEPGSPCGLSTLLPHPHCHASCLQPCIIQSTKSPFRVHSLHQRACKLLTATLLFGRTTTGPACAECSQSTHPVA